MPIQVARKETPYLPIETRWTIWGMMEDPYRDPTLLAIETGMRIGEILALQWGDVDWEGRGIDVQHTLSAGVLKDTRKSGDRIWIPWQGKVNDLFDRMRATRQLGGYVFTKATGSRIWPQQLSPAFKAVCRSLGLPKAKFHHLRNSFLHDLSEAGATTKEAGALAGHRSERTTERYIGRWSKEKVRSIANLRNGSASG
jgi:integrase